MFFLLTGTDNYWIERALKYFGCWFNGKTADQVENIAVREEETDIFKGFPDMEDQVPCFKKSILRKTLTAKLDLEVIFFRGLAFDKR